MSVSSLIRKIDSVLESQMPSKGANFVLLLGPPASGKGFVSWKKLQVFNIPEYLPFAVNIEEDPVTREGDEELRKFQRAIAIQDFNELFTLIDDPERFTRALVQKYYVTRSRVKIALYNYVTHKEFSALMGLEENKYHIPQIKKYKHAQLKSLIKTVNRAKPLDPVVFERYFKLTNNYYISMRGTGDEGTHNLETLKLAARRSFLTVVNKAIAKFRPQGGGGFVSRDLIVIDTPGEDIHRVNEYLKYLQHAKEASFGTSVVVLFPGTTPTVSCSASKMGNFARSLLKGDRMVDPKADIDGYFALATAALRKLASSEFLDSYIPLYNSKITHSTIASCRDLILDCLHELNRPDLIARAETDENMLFSQAVSNLLYSNSHLVCVQTLQKFLEDNPIFKHYEVRS